MLELFIIIIYEQELLHNNLQQALLTLSEVADIIIIYITLQQGLLTPSEIADIRQASINLLPVIRPNCVALVDAFEFQ